ncbi:uncharacterized protein [Antedon mediterranea]|uniref:uncharacterized protein n=1 Tax=Antedon mediterranea TaxID=105859 RepID=UPI003AF91DE2
MYRPTFFAFVLVSTILAVAKSDNNEVEFEERLLRYLLTESGDKVETRVDEPEARSLSGQIESMLNERGKVSCRKSLPKEKICDFVGDCPDWKDEKNCDNKYRKKGGCEALIFLKDCDYCDGFTDCADNSDEKGCPVGTPTCLEVIPDKWVCDGWRHCYDWSDEMHCEETGGNNDDDQGGNNEDDNNEDGNNPETNNNDGDEENGNEIDQVSCFNPSEGRTGNDDERDFMQQVLDAHNYYRCLHGVGPLYSSSELSDHAQEVAESNAYYGLLLHSSDTDFGENLWYKANTDGSFNENSITGLEVVKAWYDEINVYDFNNPGFNGPTGHFTQVVWKNTEQLGCGYSSKTEYGYTYVYVACNYSPAGNVLGEFAENVLREM